MPDLRLRKFDPESHVFEPAAWPEAIARWRLDFDRQLRDFNAGQPVDRRFGLTDEESLVISPLRNLIGPGRPGARPASITQVFGFTILQLDVRYMRDEILPALARRYFIHQDGDSYRVAVVSTSDPVARALPVRSRCADRPGKRRRQSNCSSGRAPARAFSSGVAVAAASASAGRRGHSTSGVARAAIFRHATKT